MYFITTKRMLEVCFFQHTPTFIIEPLFRNLEIMVANFQQIVYNKFTNKRFFIQNI